MVPGYTSVVVSMRSLREGRVRGYEDRVLKEFPRVTKGSDRRKLITVFLKGITKLTKKVKVPEGLYRLNKGTGRVFQTEEKMTFREGVLDGCLWSRDLTEGRVSIGLLG